jgi:hypothetical protein
MIPKFVQAWDARKGEVEAQFKEKGPECYGDIVKAVVNILRSDDGYDQPDPDRITLIDHGDYQGSQVFIVGAGGYQPSRYWGVVVSYGSCSGCDTLEAIRCDGRYDDDARPSESQVRDYMTLALHVVQGLKAIHGGDE